jgi:phosphoenolpyruvate synthase/pyruvate phosphate dikinase
VNYLLTLSNITPADRARIGGKGYALARLAAQGLRVPETVCLTNAAYNDYLDATGLRERILMELNRKDFQEMRWEEMWDASLRIRNFFLTTPMPGLMARALEDSLSQFTDRPVVVRSSAPEEDSSQSSFAGLHESFVNVIGAEAILHHIRLVWASLWSDAALLYRQELGLDISTSSMAVVIQELVAGEVSGVTFSRNPSNEAQTAIEAVYGLNQGLVDGLIEPDRWLIDRSTRVLDHLSPQERSSFYQTEGPTVSLKTLPEELASRPPLSPEQVWQIYEMALQLEEAFDSPQDIEWTISTGLRYLLQSRPITTVATDNPD